MEETEIPPNQQLVFAREKAQLSIERVATALNLPVKVIEALESARYKDLHGDAFVLGSLRCYSTLLGLDSNKLVAEFKKTQQLSDPIALNIHAKELSIPIKTQSQHKKYRTVYGVLAALSLMISLSFLLPSKIMDHEEMSQSISVETAIGTTVISSIDDLPTINPTQDMLPIIEQKTPLQDEVRDHVDTDSVKTLQEQKTISQGLSSLTFEFSADCWVEIFDGNNVRIIASMKRAKERLELTGKPPFKITLGYAPGVVLSYNSQPVSINSEKDNIAKLVLGNS